MFKILIVDDENLIRYCLSATFRDPAMAVRTAASGSEALLALQEDSFDVCILDLHLPDMSGIDIIHHLKARSPQTRIIIVSGESLSRENRTFVEKNAVLFVEKPFDLDHVRSFVHLLRDRGEGARLGDWSAETERRRQFRRHADALVRYSAVTPTGEARAIDLDGRIRDISDNGAQLVTDHVLEPGWWVMLTNGAQVKEGYVRWSMAAAPEGMFHSGIQLTRPAA